LYAEIFIKTVGKMKMISLLMLMMPLFAYSLNGNGQNMMNHQKHVQDKLNYKFISSFQDKINNKYSQQSQLKSAFNENYLPDSVYKYSFNSSNDSILSEKTYYTYNSGGYRTLELSYNWNKATNQWSGNYKKEYSYDSVGNISLFTQYQFVDTLNQWIGNDKYKYTYDSIGNQTSRTESWHQYNGWFVANMDIYSYDSIGNKISDFIYDSGNNTWYPRRKVEYSYDSIGNIILETHSDYLWEPDQWILDGSYKYEYTYNSNRQYTNLLHYYWNYITEQWVGDFQAEYIYGINGKQASHIYYLLDSTSNQLVTADKVEYAYDSNGNLTLESSYIWNKTENHWILLSEEYYYYEILHEVAINSQTQLLGIPFKLFPNPARQYIFLEINDKSVSQALLYNINGQLVKTFFIQPGLNTLSLNQLPKGIYIIQIPTTKSIIIQKLIKE